MRQPDARASVRSALARTGSAYVALLFDSWWLMLIVGGIHSQFAVVPALGYLMVMGILITIHIVGSWARGRV